MEENKDEYNLQNEYKQYLKTRRKIIFKMIMLILLGAFLTFGLIFFFVKLAIGIYEIKKEENLMKLNQSFTSN